MKSKDDSNKEYDKSIRKRLTRTVLIPSVTLMVLWTAVSAYFFVNGLYVRLVAGSVREVSIPAATALSAVQQERRAGLEFLENTGTSQLELENQQRDTDKEVSSLKKAFNSAIDSAPDEIASRITELKQKLDQLPFLRSRIGSRSIAKSEVNEFYNGILDTAVSLFDTQAHLVPDAKAVQGGIAATSVFRSSDTMSRSSSLMSSAFAASSFSPDDYLQFSQMLGSYRSELDRTAPFLEPGARKRYQTLIASQSWKQLVAAEDALIKHGPWTSRNQNSIPVTQEQWQQVTNQVSAGLIDLAIEQADKVSAAAIASGNDQLWRAIIGSVIALLTSAAAITVAVRVSRTLVDRTLVTRLERLRKASLDLANDRLPNIVTRLRDGEAVDVNAELPKLDHGRDEIGQVAEAFNIAQLTAVNAAASEARARSGVRNVFLGIAHRNQVLVHRQLQILDEMESREEDSTQLAALFQLDHLATRARRTTENLIILGGKQPGRRWRKPVQLMAVLRAAVSETEQYARVHVETAPEIAVLGSAVADIIHLIAELVDNATAFSPPGSQVEVTSRIVARGVVVDVADQGLGMKDTVRDWANAMMADPPAFDAMALRADSSLGLFVVAQLAVRLGITVTFDPSRYGGTRATVLIPKQILAMEEANGRGNGIDMHIARPREEANVDEPIGNVAQAAHQTPAVAMDTTNEINSQTSISRASEETQSWLGRRQVTQTQPPDSTTSDEGDYRIRLPQRRPQENLVAQLRDDPDKASENRLHVGDGTVRTLSAFHKGTRRGRESDNTNEA